MTEVREVLIPYAADAADARLQAERQTGGRVVNWRRASGVGFIVSVEFAAETTEMQADPLITAAEVETLNVARRLILELERRCADRAWDAPSNVRTPDTVVRAQSYGRAAEAFSMAESAMSNALITANVYCKADITDEQLRMDPPALEPGEPSVDAAACSDVTIYGAGSQ